MLLKQIEQNAVMSWCPIPGEKSYMATGSLAGSFDSDFSASGRLDVFEIQYSDSALAPHCAASIEIADRFNRVCWSGKVGDAEGKGLIAGGCVDGSIFVWDAAKLISS